MANKSTDMANSAVLVVQCRVCKVPFQPSKPSQVWCTSCGESPVSYCQYRACISVHTVSQVLSQKLPSQSNCYWSLRSIWKLMKLHLPVMSQRNIELGRVILFNMTLNMTLSLSFKTTGVLKFDIAVTVGNVTHWYYFIP